MTDDLAGRVVILTGGSAGIGAAAAREFRRRGATLAITGRSAETTRIATEIGAEPYLVDFTDFAAIRDFAATMLDRFPRIDVLVNNVGGIISGHRLTPDGHEQTFQVNHLSGFLLTELLRDRIAASQGRVINTSSMANLGARLDIDRLGQQRPYRDFGAYADAKLMNILHAMELARRYPEIAASSFHPGVVATDFARDGSAATRLFYNTALGRLFMISPEKGMDTMLWLATAEPGRDWVSGGFYDKRRPGRMNRRATPENARRLWDLSLQLVGLTLTPPAPRPMHAGS